MTKPQAAVLSRRMLTFAVVYSVLILGIGLWISLATGEWIALLCASGLVILPVGAAAVRAKKPR
ncbi:hypothetical protein [Salinibacterium sp. M195]|uniref:hypothetical protein n=1 Tax=Salinibacterium sp. M195 TaxID=2583374 RepID=UPI001C638527|nr:hypothetical protein [Salinibacterium sp. M195]QYH36579.1 hypothetical protein FFT87_11835 [Salinibacterium sp. M195]